MPEWSYPGSCCLNLSANSLLPVMSVGNEVMLHFITLVPGCHDKTMCVNRFPVEISSSSCSKNYGKKLKPLATIISNRYGRALLPMRVLRQLTLWYIVPLTAFGCPNNCSRNGNCNSNSVCGCADGFSGGDCSLRVCPSAPAFSDIASSTDTAHANAVCSGRGHCDTSTGSCLCHEGYTGIACERLKCENSCSNRGRCMSVRHFTDTTRNHLSQQFTYNLWDADMMNGCLCDLGYTGFDCSERVCPSGDDPLTTTDTDQEIQLLRCFADASAGGRIVLRFDGLPSSSIATDATHTALKLALETIPLVEQVDVSYSEGSVLCRDDGKHNIVSITFTSNFGPQPPLVAVQFDMAPASVIEIAADNTYGMLTDHTGADYFHVKGNKENDVCSNRGLCDRLTGSCKCFSSDGVDEYGGSDGYGNAGERGDCGHAITGTITACPSKEGLICSGHGWCDDSTKRCTCEKGYTGGDCSLRTCEKELSWFDYPASNDSAHKEVVLCSNMGSCSRTTGECSCHASFFGAACEFQGCVHQDYANSISTHDCGGHGTCLSMRELALPVSYGTNPNEQSTWDANRMFGCQCDPGWEGYDCSLRSCAVGMDPVTLSEGTCANNGLCDHDTGHCKCFAGWGSSDGTGSGTVGSKNDCGHRLKLRGYS